MIKETLRGLVVDLPCDEGTGVILHATRQRQGLYLATILDRSGNVWIAQFRSLTTNIGENIEYIDYIKFSQEIRFLL